jgi:hypothetical protein
MIQFVRLTSNKKENTFVFNFSLKNEEVTENLHSALGQSLAEGISFQKRRIFKLLISTERYFS